MKELEMDAIGKVKSVRLVADAFSRVKLPCDYVDWTRMGTPNGQYVLNMGVTKAFNRLKYEDSVGTLAPHPSPGGATLVGFGSYPYLDNYWNNNNEFTAGFYGGEGTHTDVFQIIPEQGVAQLSQISAPPGSEIILDYLYFDKANSETLVHKYAEAAISAFIEYRYLCHLPKSSPYEKEAARANWDNQVRILHARLNDLTPENIERIINRRQRQTPKF